MTLPRRRLKEWFVSRCNLRVPRAPTNRPNTRQWLHCRHSDCDMEPIWRPQVGGSLNSPWNDNSHETTTLECSNSTSWGPKAVTAVKWRLLHPESTGPLLRGNSCTHNSRQTTKSPSQQPWNDESETQRGALDFASFHGCCRFKCLLGFSDRCKMQTEHSRLQISHLQLFLRLSAEDSRGWPALWSRWPPDNPYPLN